MAEPIEMSFGMLSRVDPGKRTSWRGCTLTQPGKYGWTVRVRRSCSLMSN